ncbi:microfibril-associated glycoprotein 4-like [Acanthaster planci]|uniref:Microfibril-associated glycoprotein 4-like n=1 Tax=Acanthaster planci TaxID=133434 RepID=A0A8B7ZA00_ACAPL|nr:microfibril-associated glycoprotein 4-like [Acanthaster planci]
MESSIYRLVLFVTVIVAGTNPRAEAGIFCHDATGCERNPLLENDLSIQHFSTDHKLGGKTLREPIVYEPEVNVKEFEKPVSASCNRSEVEGFIRWRVGELERLTEEYKRDEEDFMRQVFQLHSAFEDIVASIKNRQGILPKDCSAALTKDKANSGVYTVQPRDGGAAIQVYCDMATDGGGWTVFQRRKDGSVDFYRDFDSYRQGFGDVDGEFWLGNDNLYRLTSQDDYILRIDLTDFQNNSAYAMYPNFRIADLSDYYRLSVSGYWGTAGDSLSKHVDKRFSTYDVDNDDWIKSCAIQFGGAWWYAGCYQSNLNGRYFGEPYQGIAWYTWKGNYESLRISEMKFKIMNK